MGLFVFLYNWVFAPNFYVDSTPNTYSDGDDNYWDGTNNYIDGD